LEDGGIGDIEFFDIELLDALEEEVLVEVVVETGATEAIFEVVD
jgi:hypothetical protein